MKKYVLLFILLFTFTINVKAECDNKELLAYAKNVEIKYKLTNDSTDYLYYLYVDPKRDDIRMTSTNSLYAGTTESIEIEGNIGVPSRIHFEEKTYYINVYVKDTSSVCAGELLTTLTYTVPPYNDYANTQFCYDNPDAEICQTMYDSTDMSNEDFAKAAEEYENDQYVKEKGLLYVIIFDYLIWILVPAIIFGLIYYFKIKKAKKVKENA